MAVKTAYPETAVHGVDIVREAELPAFVEFAHVNLETDSLPYPDAYFDAIMFTHVIEHLREPLNVAGQINRVLKPNGVVYIETPNWTSILVPSFGGRKGGAFNFFDDRSHTKPWTKGSLYWFLNESCKLSVRKVATARSLVRAPIDLARVLLHPRDRKRLVSAFWNLYGWCIYAIGAKQNV